NSINNIKYSFKLLYRSSRDSLKATVFHQKCDNVNKTLVVAKIQNSEQIFGGYNPLDWSGEWECKRTTESFIFNISDRNNINTTWYSYANNYDNAIHGSREYLALFGQNGCDL